MIVDSNREEGADGVMKLVCLGRPLITVVYEEYSASNRLERVKIMELFLRQRQVLLFVGQFSVHAGKQL